jgi:RecA-family ATPase
MRIEDFITPANEDSVKRLLNQALSALEIPSSFTAITDVNDLFKYQAKETEFLIEGLLPTIGVSILAAHPKTGKSWMALNFIRAILSGQSVFGELSTQNIGILYLSLEDNASRLKTRLQMVYEQDKPSIHNLKIQTRSKQFNDRTLAEFKEYLENNPDIKFVVIDPFEKIRPSSDKHSNAYQKDYKDMSALKNLAEELEISILLVHHLKKDKTSNDSDLSSLNGSMGLLTLSCFSKKIASMLSSRLQARTLKTESLR